MTALRRTLTTVAAAGLAVAALAGPAAAGNPVHPEWNNPAYWGDDCVKVEYTDGTHMIWVAPGTNVIVKAGTSYYFEDGLYYGTWLTTEKDISFVITCGTPTTPES